jgi:hypothetical protein
MRFPLTPLHLLLLTWLVQHPTYPLLMLNLLLFNYA